MFVRKYELVELPITPNFSTGKFQFTDQQYLRSVQIVGIEVFAAEDMPIAPSGNANLTLAQLQQMYFTFYTSDPNNVQVNDNGTVQGNNQGEWVKNVPALRLRNMDTGGTNQPHIRQQFSFPGNTIYWEKSYAILTSGWSNPSAASLLVGVTFQGVANS